MKLLKKRHKTSRYIESQIHLYGEREKSNEWFKDFQCSSHFEGEKLASLNMIKYKERKKRIDRKWDQLYRILDIIEERK